MNHPARDVVGLPYVLQDDAYISETKPRCIHPPPVYPRTFLRHCDPKNNSQLARAGLKLMIIVSARPFEEYFETVPHVSCMTGKTEVKRIEQTKIQRR